MFERSERMLSAREQSLLKQKILLKKKQKDSCWRRSSLNGLLISGIISALVVVFAKAPTSVVVMFFLGIWSLSFWDAFKERKKNSLRVTELEGALTRNLASTVRISTQEMLELEEIEDEGACYAFQVSDNKIVFVDGQDFYPSSRFPNTDFEIVEIFDSNSRLLDGWIVKTGKRLAPLRKISSDCKRKLNPPEHLQLLEGRLEKLESLLGLRI